VTTSKSEKVPINMVKYKKSAVDENIPIVADTFVNRYALIIGNEDYSSFQNSTHTEINVIYAKNDAKIFKEYCIKTLGIPVMNVIYIEDGTAGIITQGLNKLNKLIKLANGAAEVFFYYAGHGLPDENTKEPYLIPVDVNGTDLSAAIKMSTVYDKLTEFPSQRITVFLDACFSGDGRNQGLLAARAVKIKPKENLLNGNLVVFSAVNGEQSALPYKEQGHGLFTYFLLKKIQETKGSVSYDDLSKYIEKEVGVNSVLINNKEQTPQVLYRPALESIWETWKLR